MHTQCPGSLARLLLDLAWILTAGVILVLELRKKTETKLKVHQAEKVRMGHVQDSRLWMTLTSAETLIVESWGRWTRTGGYLDHCRVWNSGPRI